MKARRAVILTVAALLIASWARSGHELPVYPSYYPHEIEIRTVAAPQAAELLRAGRLHAFVGEAPTPGGPSPGNVQVTESLGSLLVIRLNPDSPRARDDASACTVAGAIVREIAARPHDGGFTVHPYPVTPWHGDYLHHVDRAEAARQHIVQDRTPPPANLKVRVGGSAAGLVRADWMTDGPLWDAAIEQVDIARLVAEITTTLNGWLGPRWVRSDWFHAYRVLAGSIRDPAHRQELETSVGRLQAGEYQDNVERINRERDLVQALASNCRAMVAGYTVKRSLFNAEFSGGVENISFDALEGFSSPMFLRTVKLKDFPWNGSLTLGVGTPPTAAWNPVGGFTDPFGRLAWYAIADPAVVPSPYDAGWILNRISEVEMSPRQ